MFIRGRSTLDSASRNGSDSGLRALQGNFCPELAAVGFGAVNRLVGGSNPSRGANSLKTRPVWGGFSFSASRNQLYLAIFLVVFYLYLVTVI